MLKDMNEAVEYVRKILKNYTNDKGSAETITNALIEKHNMPVSYAANIGLLVKPIEELNAIDLFCIMDVIDGEKSYSKFFTTKEIKEYKDYQYEEIKPLKKIEFNMLRVADDQYIGNYTARQLMDLQKHSLLNYNVNTQRAMKYIIRKGEEEFRIAINLKAVEEIKNAMEKNRYIPTTITLNARDDTGIEIDFQRVEKNSDYGKLVIHNVKPLDIIDGYHRYLAMSELYNTDDTFDYPIELRIVNFSEEQAKQFIYQEDQKTKMPKVASNSLNQYDFYNKICKRLNTESEFSGEIHTNGNLNAGILASAMGGVFTVRARTDISNVTKTFVKYFEKLSDERPDMVEHKWNNYQILAITYCTHKGVDIEKALKLFDYYQNPPKGTRSKFSGLWTLRKSEQKAIEEVLKNV